MSQANCYLNESKAAARLMVCRGCLASDARLYDIRENRLMEAYCTLMCNTIQVTDDLPNYLCSYCAALLLKFDAFRIKCIDALLIFRNAQLDNIKPTTEHITIDRQIHFKQSELKTIDIVDKTPKRKQIPDISTDSDISSDSDDSDDSLDELSDISDSSISDDEKDNPITAENRVENQEPVPVIEKDAPNNSDSGLECILKKYFENKDDSGLLKDFIINFDSSDVNYIENSMKKLSEILNHIQYCSETSNELLSILDEEPSNESPKSVIKKKVDVTKQETKAKPVENEKVVKKRIVQPKRATESPDSKPHELKTEENRESPLTQEQEVKVEFIDEELEDTNDLIDSEDDMTIADLKVISEPSKRKPTKSNARRVAPSRGSNKIINGILNGRKTKKTRYSEEHYAMYNTEIRYLSREEQITELMRRKESDNYKNGQFKCNFCYKGFLIEETFKNHMSLHDDISGKFVCDICQCHFMSQRRLYGHRKGHNKIFTCKECGHITRHGSLAAQHYRWHGGKKYSCKDCGKEFQNRSSQYGHIKMCHPNSDQLVRCEICGDSFNGLGGLKYHDNRTHKEMYSSECHCSGCDTQFYCSSALKAHQGAAGLCDPRAKFCVRCGRSFDTEQLLREHEAEERKPQNQFKCNMCPKTFKFFGKLKMHERRHSSTYPKYMKLYYERRGQIEKEKEENGGAELICEICGKLVKNVGYLKVHHNLVHSTDKRFKCTLCPKAFKTSALLVGHVRVHTGERPFQCQHCPKAFQNPQNLRRHDMVHTGERPHSCDVCGKKFQSRGCVKTHIKTVHMKIPMPPRTRNRRKKTE